MRQRQETYLVAARRKVNLTLQRGVENSRELLSVTRWNVLEASNHPVGFRVQPEERSHVRDLNRQALPLECGVQSMAEFLRAGIEHLKRADALNLLQCCQPGPHADRVRAQRASLINRTGWRDYLHQVTSAAVGADGKSTANYFAVGHKIRTEVQHFSHAAHRHTKA